MFTDIVGILSFHTNDRPLCYYSGLSVKKNKYILKTYFKHTIVSLHIVCRFAQNSHYHDMATLIQLTLCGVNSSSVRKLKLLQMSNSKLPCGWSPKNGISTI